MPWIDVSFTRGGEVRHIYTRDEADELIAAGILQADTLVTAYYLDGARVEPAMAMAQFGFVTAPDAIDDDDEADDDVSDDGDVPRAEAVAPGAGRASIAAQIRFRAGPDMSLQTEVPHAEQDIIASRGAEPPVLPQAEWDYLPAHQPHWLIRAVWRTFDFQGRASREEYWGSVLLYLMVVIAGALAGAVNSGLGTIVLVAAIGLIFVNLSASIRRLHDLGVSGWIVAIFFVAALIPVVNIIAALLWLVIMLIEGSRKPNQFGLPQT